MKVLSRLRTATPLQVNRQVRIAGVNRSLLKEISGSLLTSRNPALGNGFLGSVIRGRTPGTITYGADGSTTYKFLGADGTDSLGGAGKLFGLDVMASLDLGERSGMVATLAQPNLTAISGETAEFLAGGEYPVPIPGNFAGTTIEYRKYGVSLSYTPTVLSNGRISLRVRPEVSELTTDGAIQLDGFQVPALTVRRAETTVELGSGESFMIAGLMNNRSVGAIDKLPGVGDIPILGTLFKSDSFRRGETELVIVVTPYLVKPVSANEIKLPTDAYLNPNDAARLFGGQTADGVTGGDRPTPRLDPSPGEADRLRGREEIRAGRDRAGYSSTARCGQACVCEREQAAVRRLVESERRREPVRRQDLRGRDRRRPAETTARPLAGRSRLSARQRRGFAGLQPQVTCWFSGAK